MENDNHLCSTLVAWNDSMGFYGGYEECGKPAKYKVTYKCPVRNRVIENYVCGTHMQAIKKNSERLKNKRGYDSKLIITTL